jgi:predicted ATPase
VARHVADRFADGVWLAELAGVADPDLVPDAVAAALGMQHSGGLVLEALAEVLAARQVLLVLDNCEHLIDAVAQLCEMLLPVADDVRILAISTRTVRSHLDRIRGKTGSQRRADLTRLALQADLV